MTLSVKGSKEKTHKCMSWIVCQQYSSLETHLYIAGGNV